MKNYYVLGIESTCDETSFAIVKNGKEVINMVTNSQMDYFNDYGGVVPELASRNHLKNIGYVYEQLFSNIDITINDINLISVATKPGLKGSILVGWTFAKTLSMVHNIELIEVNHVQAHLLSAAITNEYKFPMITLSVSGGHTQLGLLHSHTQFELLGESLDDSLGEAFDKISMMLNLGYPGGPYIEKLALKSDKILKMPNINTSRYEYSFSGYKSYINQKYIQTQIGTAEDIANTFQETVFKYLLKKLTNVIDDKNIRNILIVGGVSANKRLLEMVNITKQKRGLNVIYPDIKYTTDNGAMIAVLGYYEKFNK